MWSKAKLWFTFFSAVREEGIYASVEFMPKFIKFKKPDDVSVIFDGPGVGICPKRRFVRVSSVEKDMKGWKEHEVCNMEVGFSVSLVLSVN